MTITEQKSLEEILEHLEGLQRIFIVGCGDCATTCQTGGEYEVEELKQKLEAAGKEVVGTAVPDTTCIVLLTKRQLRQQREAVEKADAFVCLACGTGLQALTALFDKPVIAGNNTLFIGATPRSGQHYEWCSACTECVVDQYGGVCPITRCPKGQVHGPCGGADNGKCEVDPDQDCVWTLIQQRAEKIPGLWDKLAKRMVAPRDYGKARRPRKRLYEPRRAGLTASSHAKE
ncbi:MAG: methylenetetrahydrofolate reductase C-terminal domain-containing protein [Armatimonadetes bacterium]|nr:methylenetetrahydrofolate reductase C-terminal domain-containing protein [Armatimonadota bacterium]